MKGASFECRLAPEIIPVISTKKPPKIQGGAGPELAFSYYSRCLKLCRMSCKHPAQIYLKFGVGVPENTHMQ